MSGTRLYDQVVVLPAAALADLPPARLEVRQRRLASTVVGGVAALIAIAAAIAPLALADAEVPRWLAFLAALWIGGFAALFAYLYLRNAICAGSPAGWVLREDGEHLLVNLRSHLNAHFDPTTFSVVVLPRRRVRSLRISQERGLRTHVDDDGTIFENPIRREFLDIAFDGDADAVGNALAAEQARWGRAPLGRSRANHSAVRLLPDGVLRVAWHDETNRLRPPLRSVRRELAQRYRFAETASDAQTPHQTPLRALDRAAQEARLREMVSRGERVEAIALAKVLYGMDTTDAVRFVDSLRR